MIPARSADGLVCGAQIRLDIPIREENAPADKEGTKYLWLSSSSKPMGTSSESPIHFVGDPCSRVVYVTEGLLKADICHALMNRTFAATAGANNVSKLDELFAFLKKNGTEEIIEAQDMDKYRNVHVEKGASKIYLMARKHGLQCRRLTWNPNYKGLDDWQLALRKNAGKAPKTMTFRERYLHGVCEVSEIDACVERWHKAQPDGVPLQAYLGLLDEEYHAFLQPGGNAQLAELLNAQRKQRHDELAARGEEMQLTLRAGELLQTYPHIEQNLQAIREKFAFTGKQFQIQVPDKLEDIFMDSRKLCHCIANSDVYWERMERRESYLLFLRKTAEPDTPYYTVEAEPGGTVRQVRTQYNRQNDDIGEVRAFLKIWQKQLAKRLTQKDKQLAADSHELRIKELVQLRNDQVTIHTGDLAGRLLVDVLTEDLMEAA